MARISSHDTPYERRTKDEKNMKNYVLMAN